MEANYNIIVVFAIDSHESPWVYMCSPSWTLLLPPSPSHPSGSSKCTGPEHPVSCIKPGLMICFTYGNIHVSMLFSQIIPLSPFPPQSPKVCSLHLCLKTDLSVQFSHSVVPDSLRPHEPQHARPPCASPTPRVHPNPCPLCRWCHPTISSSVIPFSSCPQSFPASGSFQMSQLSASGGQSIAVSASTSVPPMNTQDWSPLEWTGWISLQSKGLSRVFSNTTVQKHQFFHAQLSL